MSRLTPRQEENYRNSEEYKAWERRSRACDHDWIPLAPVYETQNLDQDGRVLIRQPSILKAHIYCVCMKCRTHTYIETNWWKGILGEPHHSAEQWNGLYSEEAEDIP